MSQKKSRVGSMLRSIRNEMKGNSKTKKVLSPPDVSSIEKASFLDDNEGTSYSNPLHSTALEDDFSPALVKMAKPPKPSATRKATKVSAAWSTKTILKENRTPKKKKASAVKPRSLLLGLQSKKTAGKQTGSEVALSSVTPPEEQSLEEDESDLVSSRPVLEPPHQNQRKGMSKAVSPTVQEKVVPALSECSSASCSQRDTAVTARRSRQASLSSEDLSDADPSWSAQTGRTKSLSKKSSFPGSSTVRRKVVAKKRDVLFKPLANISKPAKKDMQQSGDNRKPIDLDVVLTAFQDCVSSYMESLDSGKVKKVINAFSESFESQLVELISEIKGLNSLKKQNVKLNSAINQKRARLVEVKNELIRKEAELRKLQKEHTQLEQRLTDIRSSTAFLADLQDLQKNYLTYREKHPNEVEVYGPSSLPTLLLEARCAMDAEHQLSIINHKLQKVLDQANLTIDSHE